MILARLLRKIKIFDLSRSFDYTLIGILCHQEKQKWRRAVTRKLKWYSKVLQFVICRILTLDLTMKISHAHPKDHASRVFIWWWTVFLGTDQRTLLILNCRTSLSYNSQLLLMNACITKNLYLMFEALYCCYARRNLENARYSMVSKFENPLLWPSPRPLYLFF